MIYLADLDPRTVRADVLRAVADHIASLTVAVAPTMDAYALPGPDDMTVLGAEVEALTLYAQRGLPVWDWTDSGMAADGLLAVLSALYSRAADTDLSHTAIDVVDDVDPSDPIGLVLVAAAARIRIDRDEPVSARELAVLGGVSATYVRRLIRSEELRATAERPARIAPEDARRWLAVRGVLGIE